MEEKKKAAEAAKNQDTAKVNNLPESANKTTKKYVLVDGELVKMSKPFCLFGERPSIHKETITRTKKHGIVETEEVETNTCHSALIAAPIVIMWNAQRSDEQNPSKKPRKAPYKKPEAVKVLEQMADEEQQLKHPNFPPKYLAKSKYRDDTANGLTKCIVDFIRLKGGQAERINTTGIPIDTRQQVTDVLGRTRTIGSVRWRTSGATSGSADISATIRGRSVKIEVKIGKDRQSDEQRNYQAAIEAAGGLYFIARNFTEFARWYAQQFTEGGAR